MTVEELKELSEMLNIAIQQYDLEDDGDVLFQINKIITRETNPLAVIYEGMIESLRIYYDKADSYVEDTNIEKTMEFLKEQIDDLVCACP